MNTVTRPGRPQLQEVANGIYAYIQPDGTWWINNTGFAVGPQGVIAIDSCSTELRTRAFLDTIRSVTAAPVRTLVNTHHHGDHTFGNVLFPGATIVAHEQTRTEAIAFGPAGKPRWWDNPEWGQLSLEAGRRRACPETPAPVRAPRRRSPPDPTVRSAVRVASCSIGMSMSPA